MAKKQTSDLQINGSSLATWKDYHTKLAVFFDMFTFYTETLTDKGKYKNVDQNSI